MTSRRGKPQCSLAGGARRRRLVVAVGLAIVAVAIALLALTGTRSSPRLGVENYSQVQIGMLRAEVEALLGGPPGDYGENADDSSMESTEEYAAPPGSVQCIWCDDSNWIEIYFDDQHRVVGHHKREFYNRYPSDSFLEKLWRHARRKLGF